jgi:hypothetical protein
MTHAPAEMYEKFTWLSGTADDIKQRMSFSHSDVIASKYSDNESTNRMNEAATQMFS